MKKQFVTALVLPWESAARHLQPILFLTFPLVIGLCRGCQAGRGRDCRWLS